MLSVEHLTFFADNFSGKNLEILLYLFAGFSQQDFSFFHLLPHYVTGGLQGSVTGIDFPALSGQFVALLSEPLDIRLVLAGFLL
jgi:hypothetical protein